MLLSLPTIVTLKLVRRKWYDSTVHRVNVKNNRVVMLRIAAYSVIMMLSAITTALLLFIALGYRFNNKGNIIHSGLLLVDNKPEAAQVYVNGELKDSRTPSRFVLPIGGYELSLELNGYRGWKKNLTIKGEAVERVSYPILIPKKLSAKSVLSTPAPQMVTQSPDNKILVNYVAGESVFRVIELNSNEPKESTIVLPSAFTLESGSVGILNPIEWSLNGKQILVSQKLPSGVVKVVSVNLDKPEESVNITDRFAEIAPEYVHYKGAKTDLVYGLNNGILRTYNILNGETSFVMDRVISYKPFSDDKIAFTALNKKANRLVVGIKNNDTRANLEEYQDTTIRPVVSYGEYDNHAYLVVVGGDQSQARVYRDPLKKPILKRQIVFTKLPIKSADYIKFSPDNQFVTIRQGANYATYDFENTRKYNFKINENQIHTSLKWINNSHLAYQSTDGNNYLVEFDGMNKQKLVNSINEKGLFYGPNLSNVYRFNTVDTQSSLQIVPLSVK